MTTRRQRLENARQTALNLTLCEHSMCSVHVLSLLASLFNEDMYVERWPSFVHSSLDLINTATELFHITQKQSKETLNIPATTRQRLADIYSKSIICPKYDKRRLLRIASIIYHSQNIKTNKLTPLEIWLGILIDTMPEITALLPAINVKFLYMTEDKPFISANAQNYALLSIARIDRFLKLPPEKRDAIKIFWPEFKYAIGTVR